MTTSEAARHVRAELEAIASGLSLRELERLLALGRRLCEGDPGAEGTWGAEDSCGGRGAEVDLRP
jgi:hypothetical protein